MKIYLYILKNYMKILYYQKYLIGIKKTKIKNIIQKIELTSSNQEKKYAFSRTGLPGTIQSK